MSPLRFMECIVQKLQIILIFIIVASSAVIPFFLINESERKERALKQNVNPPPVPATMPDVALPNFSTYTDVKQKKQAFFEYLVPIIHQVNREVVQEREFLDKLHSRPSSGHDSEKLSKLAKKYDVELEQEFQDIKDQLMLKVDELPVTLVAMQAANESAWGTSRFAVKANNLFGQWCFTKGCGLIPSGRPDGKTYEVRKFKHPLDSVRSYFHNLNSGWAYEDLRQMRAKLRQENKQVDAHMLAEGLLAYSTRRELYVEEIQQMIRVNKKYISNADS